MKLNSLRKKNFKLYYFYLLIIFFAGFILTFLTNTIIHHSSFWDNTAIIFIMHFVIYGLFMFITNLLKRNWQPTEDVSILKRDIHAYISNFGRSFDRVPEAIFIFYNDTIFYANDAAVKVYGASSSSDFLNQNIGELMGRKLWEHFTTNIDENEAINVRDITINRFDGFMEQVDLLLIPIQINVFSAKLVVLHHTHQNKIISQELKRIESQLHTIINNLDVGIWSFDIPNQSLLLVNNQFAQLVGKQKEEIILNPTIWKSAIFPNDIQEEEKWFSDLMSGQAVTTEMYFEHNNASTLYFESKVFPVKDETGNVVRLDGILVDITNRVLFNKRSEFIAYHDELTLLPNRRKFKEMLHSQKHRANKNNHRFAVLYMDMNKFKEINDKYGHAIGDLYLKEVASRLQLLKSENQDIFRIGGDEFTIIFYDVKDKIQIEAWIQQLLDAFKEPFITEDKSEQIHILTSIGIAVYPDDAVDTGLLVNHADLAMYEAKKNKVPFQYYNDEVMKGQMDKNVMDELKQALNEGQFILHYQPKYDIKTKTITGTEALIRWLHPKKGLLNPSDFIPLAEKLGLITEIGNWVIEQACQQISEWTKNGFSIPISVNLSPIQFYDTQLVHFVKKIIMQYKIKPEFLEIEITENIAIHVEHAITVLQQLHEIGVVIAVDDFGIGYSSLNYLNKFPISKLKIDRSFITNITTQTSDKKIVSTIIELAHDLHLRVVAEGVETEQQLQLLEQLNCDEAQGYFFCKPIPPEALEKKLKENIQVINQETHKGARLKGVFLKNVIGALLTGTAMFPEYKKLIEEIDDHQYYSWDLYTKMLQDVAAKLSPTVVRDVGIRVILSGKDVFIKEQGYDTLEKLLRDYPAMHSRTIIGLPEHERLKLLKYEKGYFCLLHTTRQPKDFNEGVIRAFFIMYGETIKSFHIERYNEHYYKIEVTW